ncbi:TPA: histidine kinase [Pseudomonas aeruginosa]|nr:histidine kinase [Pseudomonas aeruginosa]HDP4846723.1 histidine kinase [Pseudomonas aeruginosa]HDU8989838.1 histidine kinase [Pseudomonas aeruginosa]HDU9120741.1 histidine kinase [Pseudomonas aeruginosa]HEJ2803092.1 histidine kinase [Pseudomonas aeruginosa]
MPRRMEVLLQGLLDEPGSWLPLAHLLDQLAAESSAAPPLLLLDEAELVAPLLRPTQFCNEMDCPMRNLAALSAGLCRPCLARGERRRLWPLEGGCNALLLVRGRSPSCLPHWLPLLEVCVQGISRQRAKQRLQQYGQDTELARELHDSVAQQLGFLALQAKQLQGRLRHPEEAEPLLGELRHGLQKLQRQVRELIGNARLSLEVHSLRQSLLDSVEEFGRRSTIVFELDNRLPDNLLDNEQTLQVLQIVREALANIVRHSHARVARIDLRLERNEVLVAVEDDGIGLQACPANGHFGLSIMRERALTIGGSLSVQSIQPRGTRVVLRLSGFASNQEDNADA